MAKIQFENGIVVEFQGQPTAADVEEIANQLKITPVQKTIKPNTTLLNKVTKVTNAISPGGKIGESIGTLAGYGVTAAKERFGLAPKGATAAYDLSAPKPLQVGADIASGALNVAGFKGVGTAGSFLSRVAKTFGIGAGIGAAETIKNGGTAQQAMSSGLKTGAFGAAFPVVGAGLRLTGRQINSLPDRFLNSALGRSKPQILKEIASGRKDTLNNYILQNKPVGTARQLAADSASAIKKIDAAIQSKLSTASRKSGAAVSIGRNNILDTVAQTPDAKGALMNRADIYGIVTRLAPQTKRLLQKPSLTLEEANSLRKAVDRTLGDRAFLMGQLGNDKTILKSFANTLRETVKTKAPPEVRGLFSEYANEIQFRDALLGQIAQKSKNQVLSFGDVLGGTIGGIAGGGIPGAVVGIAGRRVVESVPFKIGSAKLLNAVSKVGTIIEELTPAQQTAILILIADLVSPDETDRELNSQSGNQI